MRESARYGPGGIGHRIMIVLGRGRADRGAIYVGSNLHQTAKGHERLPFVLTQMLADGFIVLGRLYELTDAGRDALDTLSAGLEVRGPGPITAGKLAERDRDGPLPTVRIFTAGKAA